MDTYKIFLETDKEPIISLDVAWGELSGSIQNQGDLIDLLSHYATKFELADNVIDLTNEIQDINRELNNKIDSSKGETDSKLDEKADKDYVDGKCDDLLDKINGLDEDVNNELSMLAGQIESLGNSVVSNTNGINDINNKLKDDYFNKTEINEKLSDIENHTDIKLNAYLTKSEAIQNYQPKGNYLTEANLSNYYDKDQVLQKIAEAEIGGEVVLQDYLKKEEAEETYQHIGDYLTNDVAESTYAKLTDIPTPYDDSALINKINSISGNVETLQTKSDNTYSKSEVNELINNIPTYDDTEIKNKLNSVSNDVDVLKANSGITSDVITLSGEVITLSDKVAGNTLKIENKANVDDVYTKSEIDNKHFLTEHQKLKTINNQSLIGEGNITIQGGGAAYDDTEIKNEIKAVSGDVATLKTASGNTYTKTEADNKFATKDELPNLTNYYTKTDIDSKGYLTEIPSTYALKSDIPSIPTNVSAFNNDAGYLTQHQSLNGYATETWVNNKGYLTSVPDTYAKKTDIPTDYVKSTEYQTVDMVGTKEDGSTITIKVLVKK